MDTRNAAAPSAATLERLRLTLRQRDSNSSNFTPLQHSIKCPVTDTIDTDKRSEIMSRIRSRDTKPEMIVRRIAHRLGFRFRLHVKDMPGSPDLVFPRHRAVIMVHGCFWHRHPGCRRASTPKTRKTYWEGKFQGNVVRDRRSQDALTDLGWRVMVIWECETRDQEAVAARIRSFLGGGAGARAPRE